MQICDLLKIVESLAALYKSASSASITPCIAACETSVASTTSVLSQTIGHGIIWVCCGLLSVSFFLMFIHEKQEQ